jgi:hypothetical protein
MKKMPRIVDAEPVIHSVLRVRLGDGCAGPVDLRPLIAEGKVLAWPPSPEYFAAVTLDEFGIPCRGATTKATRSI